MKWVRTHFAEELLVILFIPGPNTFERANASASSSLSAAPTDSKAFSAVLRSFASGFAVSFRESARPLGPAAGPNKEAL